MKIKRVEHLFILVAAGIFAILLTGTALFYFQLIAGEEPGDGPLKILCVGCFCAMPVLSLAEGLWLIKCASHIKREIELWDGNDWEDMEEADLQMDAGLFSGQFFEFAGLIVFVICINLYMELWRENVDWQPVIPVVLYWLPHLVSGKGFAEMKRNSRKLHPERRYSADDVYDAHTLGGLGGMKAWMKESDEGERRIVYEAAYKAYKRGNWLSVFLLFMTGSLSVSYHKVFLIFTVAAVFWFLMNITFYCERSRLRRQGVQEQEAVK